MPEYWGLDAIGLRMGVNQQTVRRWHRDHAFLMYPRRKGPRTIWYTNDVLIQTWELARCRQAREAVLDRRAARQTSPGR